MLTNITDVKRYLRVASIANDGLLVVRKDQPLLLAHDCVIVPRQFLKMITHCSSHRVKSSNAPSGEVGIPTLFLCIG